MPALQRFVATAQAQYAASGCSRAAEICAGRLHSRLSVPSTPSMRAAQAGGCPRPGGMREACHTVHAWRRAAPSRVQRMRERAAARRQGGHVALKYALRAARAAPACIALSTWLEPDSEAVRAKRPRSLPPRRAQRGHTVARRMRRVRIPSNAGARVPARQRRARAMSGTAAAAARLRLAPGALRRGARAARRPHDACASCSLRLARCGRPAWRGEAAGARKAARRPGRPTRCPTGSLDARACRCPQQTWTHASSWATAPQTRSSPASCPTPASLSSLARVRPPLLSVPCDLHAVT